MGGVDRMIFALVGVASFWFGWYALSLAFGLSRYVRGPIAFTDSKLLGSISTSDRDVWAKVCQCLVVELVHVDGGGVARQ